MTLLHEKIHNRLAKRGILPSKKNSNLYNNEFLKEKIKEMKKQELYRKNYSKRRNSRSPFERLFG